MVAATEAQGRAWMDWQPVVNTIVGATISGAAGVVLFWWRWRQGNLERRRGDERDLRESWAQWLENLQEQLAARDRQLDSLTQINETLRGDNLRLKAEIVDLKREVLLLERRLEAYDAGGGANGGK